ncbi:hypothetical protein F4825DRAFT_438688 [Nemania diffusa]|nr:hypothetical protein F4825DRAFT_438688 [Nemania diffusa]
MPPHISTSSSASGNSMADTPSNHDRRAITTIPGRGIHPSKLVNILQTRFGDKKSLQNLRSRILRYNNAIRTNNVFTMVGIRLSTNYQIA